MYRTRAGIWSGRNAGGCRRWASNRSRSGSEPTGKGGKGMDTINREHPEYVARKGVWRQYSDLYTGGEQLRANASLYLVRRNKEPGEVYLERLARAFYENYVGSIIDWYAATLMRTAPGLIVGGSGSA